MVDIVNPYSGNMWMLVLLALARPAFAYGDDEEAPVKNRRIDFKVASPWVCQSVQKCAKTCSEVEIEIYNGYGPSDCLRAVLGARDGIVRELRKLEDEQKAKQTELGRLEAMIERLRR